MRRRNKSAPSLLKKQRLKPKHTRKITFFKHLRKHFLKIILSSVTSVFFYHNIVSNSETIANRVQTKIQIRSSSLLPKTYRKHLKKIIHSSYLKYPQHLERIAEDIHSKFSYIDRIVILKVDAESILAKIKIKNPVAKILSDENHQYLLVTANGKVYPKTYEKIDRLPLVKGIPIPTTSSKNAARNLIPVSSPQRTLLLEALELYRIADNASVSINVIQYIKYRGFLVNLSDSKVSAQLGRPPFSDRILHLKNMIVNLKQQGIHRSHIDLDFEDKVFIEKKYATNGQKK